MKSQPNLFDSEMIKGAILSPCGSYRYTLMRTWDPSLPRVCFVMLNPSTADAEQDDPTIRRCMGFARSWGYGSIAVVNLFAFRATDPRKLRNAHLPIIGPENNTHIINVCDGCEMIVLAWGNGGHKAKRVREVLQIIRPKSEPGRNRTDGYIYAPQCLGVTKQGQPKHPLYVSADTQPQPFEETSHV